MHESNRGQDILSVTDKAVSEHVSKWINDRLPDAAFQNYSNFPIKTTGICAKMGLSHRKTSKAEFGHSIGRQTAG